MGVEDQETLYADERHKFYRQDHDIVAFLPPYLKHGDHVPSPSKAFTNFENIIDSEDIHYSLQRDCQWLIKGNDALANFGEVDFKPCAPFKLRLVTDKTVADILDDCSDKVTNNYNDEDNDNDDTDNEKPTQKSAASSVIAANAANIKVSEEKSKLETPEAIVNHRKESVKLIKCMPSSAPSCNPYGRQLMQSRTRETHLYRAVTSEFHSKLPDTGTLNLNRSSKINRKGGHMFQAEQKRIRVESKHREEGRSKESKGKYQTRNAASVFQFQSEDYKGQSPSYYVGLQSPTYYRGPGNMATNPHITVLGGTSCYEKERSHKKPYHYTCNNLPFLTLSAIDKGIYVCGGEEGIQIGVGEGRVGKGQDLGGGVGRVVGVGGRGGNTAGEGVDGGDGRGERGEGRGGEGRGDVGGKGGGGVGEKGGGVGGGERGGGEGEGGGGGRRREGGGRSGEGGAGKREGKNGEGRNERREHDEGKGGGSGGGEGGKGGGRGGGRGGRGGRRRGGEVDGGVAGGGRRGKAGEGRGEIGGKEGVERKKLKHTGLKAESDGSAECEKVSDYKSECIGGTLQTDLNAPTRGLITNDGRTPPNKKEKEDEDQATAIEKKANAPFELPYFIQPFLANASPPQSPLVTLGDPPLDCVVAREEGCSFFSVLTMGAMGSYPPNMVTGFDTFDYDWYPGDRNMPIEEGCEIFFLPEKVDAALKKCFVPVFIAPDTDIIDTAIPLTQFLEWCVRTNNTEKVWSVLYAILECRSILQYHNIPFTAVPPLVFVKQSETELSLITPSDHCIMEQSWEEFIFFMIEVLDIVERQLKEHDSSLVPLKDVSRAVQMLSKVASTTSVTDGNGFFETIRKIIQK